jgi:biopolymer transport protein ExbB
MTFDPWILVEKGGPVAVIILVMSAVAMAVTAYKILQFCLLRVGRHRIALRAVDQWLAGDHDNAYAAVESHRSPLSRAVAHAMRGLTHGGGHIAAVKDDVARVAGEELHTLAGHLRLIELISQLAPLLGLFGTVIGMIQAFSELQQSGAVVNPAALAGGIWTALLTTALGLAVAIVFSTVSSWFEGRIEAERSIMETTLTGFFANRITEDVARDLEEVTTMANARRGHAN